MTALPFEEVKKLEPIKNTYFHTLKKLEVNEMENNKTNQQVLHKQLK
jgi:hypothetical protein